ncbi:DUF3106 domain-containing protein [Paracidovorax valerianellae]|uniref:DUF3106 domain-containing protein n=1 Tax=Paracidovorax valerianellae TaxID=187868 RepID=A0A1G6UQU6_9BURK|nr:DUF3106 domain-containing protein [Paracidovorax valerianellae]MDA8446862.1 DUF3106 domain-containing protein [Paracidovorax valerianellae]SDD43076.1 Protein of unknown function [Paracidovorax valerianellae]
MPTSPLDAPRLMPAAVLAFALLGALVFGGWQAWTQVGMAPVAPLPAEALASKHTARGPEVRVQDPDSAGSGPTWQTLTAAQKEALHPLAARWTMLSEAQKRRWITLSASFPTLSPQEREKMLGRMADWANLSLQQRSQARLNYAATKKLSVDDKWAQWEAYQALPTEEKKQLAARAAPRPAGAATAIKPVPARKLARVPAATVANANRPNPPKIPPVSEFHPTQALPVSVPATGTAVAVETAPVAVPIAVPAPLAPLNMVEPAPEAPAATPPTPATTPTDNGPIHPPQ